MAAIDDSASLTHLFEPLQVGPMTVANRIVMAPMERNYAHRNGTVSERTIAHYRARARGGVGWIDVESTFVDPIGRGRTHQLGIDDDRCVDGFRALAEAVHAEGARIGIELHHAGRNTSRAISGYQPVAPSPVPCPEAGGDVPRELTEGEIEEILRRYAAAGARAAQAGFDAVELHSAHGYLPLAFLSPLTNLRTDDYGGSLENRMRFALRAIGALRDAVGHDVAVGCRFSADEHLAGGLTLDDTVRYAVALQSAGVDYLSVSSGVYASFTRIIPPMDFTPGWLLASAATIKQAVDVPVIGASRIVEPRLADRAIASGQVDMVALGRALLTDAEFPNKAREGRSKDIVSCIGCNQGCENRISNQLDVTCLVNPEVGREQVFALVAAPTPKRVVVVGGGPAGMEAARVCAQRGHRVTLYERAHRLGGMIVFAAMLPQRTGWVTYLQEAERRLRVSGVEVRLQETVDEATLAAAGADTVVLAAGSRFEPPEDLRRSLAGSLLTVPELLRRGEPPDGHMVVAGAGAIGLGVAAWLVAAGARVTVVCAEREIVDPDGQGGLLQRLLDCGQVALRPERKILSAAGSTVTLARSGAIGPLFCEDLDEVGAVIWAAGRRSRAGLASLVRRRGLAGEVHEIGDCRTPLSALEAIYEGAVVARNI